MSVQRLEGASQRGAESQPRCAQLSADGQLLKMKTVTLVGTATGVTVLSNRQIVIAGTVQRR